MRKALGLIWVHLPVFPKGEPHNTKECFDQFNSLRRIICGDTTQLPFLFMLLILIYLLVSLLANFSNIIENVSSQLYLQSNNIFQVWICIPNYSQELYLDVYWEMQKHYYKINFFLKKVPSFLSSVLVNAIITHSAVWLPPKHQH